MLKDKEKIQQWLDQYNIKNYTINDDFTVDIKGNVDLSYKNLTEIEVQFNIVEDNFYCHNNNLTSLIGCPQSIGGNFSCFNNELTSLQSCPKTLVGNFNCNNNNLISLEGCPQSVGGNFYCIANTITNIENFKCEFGGNFIHGGEKIPLLENFYTSGINKNLLKITHFQLQNILLNHKLNDNVVVKASQESNKKNKL